ncbi:MAG: COGs COG1934 [uncultured Sphingomonadaceae bacterium]|uniref:COGs COG1934 n=1 Tax=uncultured Sphingomonadaceae bacterium TaxID=169976 RepID=A0A6J4S4B9_9SPHN|nr:MAG: COGs COG1934 [uncultured Sphingomonadaceae bacterium]
MASRPLLLSCALVLLAAPALGQSSASGGFGLSNHDTGAPVDVSADRIEVQDRVDRAIFSGSVRVKQGNLRLAADRVTLAYSTAGGIEIDRIDASGGVTVTSPTERATGRFGIYDTDRRLITLVGDVVLNRGANELRGGRLAIDLTSGRAVMEGGAAGVSAAPGGRVSGTFTVPRRGG